MCLPLRTRTTLVARLPFVRLSGKRVRIGVLLLQEFYSHWGKERQRNEWIER